MDIAQLHGWDLTPREAMALQRELAARVVREGDLPQDRVQFIAGADVAFDKPNGRGVGAVVVLVLPSLETVEEVVVEAPVTFPYVPGLLSFRETPLLLEAFWRLKQRPDLVMADGHGYSHPRRFGFACHLGLLLGIPTIGIAKSRLIGEQGTVAGPRQSRADLTHEGEVIGSVLRTKQGVRSIYVSVGHGLSLASAEVWALRCAAGYRVPEPTRRADRLAGVTKRRMLDATLPIIIEQRAGEGGRWEWDYDRDEVVFRHELAPMPEHYGCSVDIINPADGELLDVILVDDRPYERGQRVTVRVVDVLRRRDGDDKLLAVAADQAWPPTQRIERARRAVWEWNSQLEKPITHWGGEDDAIAMVRACTEAGA